MFDTEELIKDFKFVFEAVQKDLNNANIHFNNLKEEIKDLLKDTKNTNARLIV